MTSWLSVKFSCRLSRHHRDLLCTASVLHQRTLSSPTRGMGFFSQDLDRDLGRESDVRERPGPTQLAALCLGSTEQTRAMSVIRTESVHPKTRCSPGRACRLPQWQGLAPFVSANGACPFCLLPRRGQARFPDRKRARPRAWPGQRG